ncbi:MAG: translation initiation factor IF-2 [Verrucomicrobia bacterium]|nr:MAG: translation initiation factor IF-2 [Verrucomicrobiota bacterium]
MATRVTSSKAKGGAPRSGRQSGASRGTGKKAAQHPPRKEERVNPIEAPAPPKVPLSLIEPKQKVKKNGGEKAPKLRPFLDSIGKSAASVKPADAPAQAEGPPPVAPQQAPAAEKSSPPPGEATEATVGLKTIHIKPPIVVRDLAQQLNLKPFQIIHDLMELNIFAAINQTIEPDIASKLCEKHGFQFEREKRKSGEGHHKLEVSIVAPPPPPIEKVAEELVLRAPIITFMGHVDHGKTSLLDAIRKAKVAAGEAGGITQHIGAYSIKRNGNPITFLDTPGHAAFTAMRARGANVTDIVVLVVAADDGLMPQTIEAINHAKAAKVTIMVAINKMDLPTANMDRVKQQLQEKGLTPEDWGGETICIPVSATKGTGIQELLDMMILQAEILELKASKRTPARCTVIEAQLEPGRGPTATVIVRMGTLQVGKSFICGNHWGKVKQLIDDNGKAIREAGPATPVKVLGLSGLPNAGDELVVMDSERSARTLSEERLEAIRTHKLNKPQRATLENLFQNIANEQKKSLQIILKADVQGSMEALIASLKEIPSRKISLDILHSAIGPISESDVLLASASNAVIIGFNVKVENTASGIAKREGIQIKLYSIIYELIDQVKEAMAGMLDPQLRETVIGHAEVKQVFTLSKGKVAGCVVKDGRIARTARARLLRKRQPIFDGGLATLRRFQDDVKEVRAGLECGIKLGDFSEYQPEDIVECYTLDKVPQSLE